uniref:Neurochondrin n=1 Tax=Araucaria cunninghamii TaxID=56994 RepID=A0A0D6R2E7_ARACU
MASANDGDGTTHKGGLEECLKLLSGERDEQRLAGLLLATKFCQGDDKDSLIKVFNALGMRFLDRLLKTGTGRSTGKMPPKDQQEAYLQLALTIFAAFCRVPELASLNDVISKVPIILETLSNKSEQPNSTECFECLLGIATASEKGFLALCESRTLPIVANHVYNSPADCLSIELAMRLIHYLLSKMPLKVEISEYADQLATVVVAIARQFTIQQTSLKFDALLLLTILITSEYSVLVRNALKLMSGDAAWPTYVRSGIGTILQNRVVADKKHLVLVLAESMMDMFGADWLVGPMELPGEESAIPSDRCLLLVLETTRVEVSVMLNELARLKFESSDGTGYIPEEATIRQWNIANCYALVENIIQLISNACEKQDNHISESSMVKATAALNELVGVVIDFLQDAKAHGITKGDDLLASVRVVGRYLAETPSAYKKQFQQLLPYILSISGQDEERSFLSIQFLLPTLCQTTMDTEGCNALLSCGGHKQVVDFLSRLLHDILEETIGTVLLACDTILNILLKKDQIQAPLHVGDFISFLPALVDWAAKQNSPMVIAMASSICILVLDLSNEKSLKAIPEFQTHLNTLSPLIIQSLELSQQAEKSAIPADDQDLYDIVVSGCAGLMDRYPTVKHSIRTSSWFQNYLQNRSSLESIMDVTMNPSLQALLASIIS